MDRFSAEGQRLHDEAMDEVHFKNEIERLENELNELKLKQKIAKCGISNEYIENLKRHISVKVKEGSGMGSSWADAYVYYDDILIKEQNIYSY